MPRKDCRHIRDLKRSFGREHTMTADNGLVIHYDGGTGRTIVGRTVNEVAAVSTVIEADSSRVDEAFTQAQEGMRRMRERAEAEADRLAEKAFTPDPEPVQEVKRPNMVSRAAFLELD